MKQVQAGLHKELQARIDAQGPRNVEDLQQCIQEYQLQYEGAQAERRPSFPQWTESLPHKKSYQWETGAPRELGRCWAHSS